MPTRIKYDEEIETEAKVLKSIANYKKVLAKLARKLHDKGDTMQKELSELAATGSDADVYAVMYQFQKQNIEARIKAEELEKLAQIHSLQQQQELDAQQTAIYADLFGAEELIDDGGDTFPDDISEGSHDSFRNFGPPGAGSVPPPGLSLGLPSRQGSVSVGSNMVSRQATFSALSTPGLSRLGSLSGQDILLADAGDLVDGNNLTDELRAKLNMSGKSRRQKMKAMEDHLKEVADAIAAEQARQDLRARTFDEYWLCIGPADKKKAKKSKSGSPSGKATASGKSTPTPSSPATAETAKEPTFFDTFLKKPDLIKESLTEKMWKSTSAKTIQKVRKRRNTRHQSSEDPYDDISIDSLTTEPFSISQGGDDGKADVCFDPDVNMDSVYIFNNPAMWSSGPTECLTSISLSKSEPLASFEDAGKSAPKRRQLQSKMNIQDAFANVGASELARLRAARNRVDKLHADEGLLGNPFGNEDFDGSELSSVASNASESEAAAPAVSSTAMTGNLSVIATDVDLKNPTMLIHSAIMAGTSDSTVSSKPMLSRSNSKAGSNKHLMDTSIYDLDANSIAQLKRVPPGLQVKRDASSSRRASVAPTVETMTEEILEDGEEADKQDERRKLDKDQLIKIADEMDMSRIREETAEPKIKGSDESCIRMDENALEDNDRLGHTDNGDQSPTFRTKRLGSYVPSTTNMAHNEQVEAYMSLAEEIEGAVLLERGDLSDTPLKPTHLEKKVHFDDQNMGDKVAVSSQADIVITKDDDIREEDKKHMDEPLGHVSLDSQRMDWHVPDEDDISEITIDDRTRSEPVLATALTQASGVDISLVGVDVTAGMTVAEADKPLDSGRSDITDSDNERDADLLSKPVVAVVVQQPNIVKLSQEAVDFKKEAESVPRKALEKSSGPVMNNYDTGSGGLIEDKLEFLTVDMEALTDTYRHERNNFVDAAGLAETDGVAFYANGGWKLVPSTTNISSDTISIGGLAGQARVQGKYFKEQFAEAKGLRVLDTSAMHPLTEVNISTFSPMRMPKPPAVVDAERVANATKPVKQSALLKGELAAASLTASEFQQAVVRVRSQSPVGIHVLVQTNLAATSSSSRAPKRSKTGAVIRQPPNNRRVTVTLPRSSADGIRTMGVDTCLGLEVAGTLAITIPVENCMEDDNHLLSDHILAQRENRYTIFPAGVVTSH
jgi:hypothetical protein